MHMRNDAMVLGPRFKALNRSKALRASSKSHGFMWERHVLRHVLGAVSKLRSYMASVGLEMHDVEPLGVLKASRAQREAKRAWKG